jgi:hypothetical protein
MVKSYSLLFLGCQTFKGTLSLEDSIDCWQQVTVVLHNCLQSLEQVAYSFRDNNSRCFEFYSRLPKVDAVLFWGVPQTWMSYDHKRLREATGCRAIITVWAGVLTENADWRFAFRDEGRLTTRIDAPVWKRLYTQCAKCPRTVLIDHWDQNTPCDWTYKIETWMQDLENEFEISRYVQHESETVSSRRENCLPCAKTMRRGPFTQWLDATDRLETFVVTHCESYGYAILDMFARRTRVLCPTPLLPPHFKNKFYIGSFNSRNELVALLRTPPNALELTKNRDGLTDFADMAKQIDDKFRSLLSHGSQHRLVRAFGRLLDR